MRKSSKDAKKVLYEASSGAFRPTSIPFAKISLFAQKDLSWAQCVTLLCVTLSAPAEQVYVDKTQGIDLFLKVIDLLNDPSSVLPSSHLFILMVDLAVKTRGGSNNRPFFLE